MRKVECEQYYWIMAPTCLLCDHNFKKVKQNVSVYVPVCGYCCNRATWTQQRDGCTSSCCGHDSCHMVYLIHIFGILITHALERVLCGDCFRIFCLHFPLVAFTGVVSTYRNVTKRFNLLKEFTPPRWSRGPLFQLYCAIACPTPNIDYKPEVLRLRDGGSVVLDWSHRPSKAPGAPIAIILPGIGVTQLSRERCCCIETALLFSA